MLYVSGQSPDVYFLTDILKAQTLLVLAKLWNSLRPMPTLHSSGCTHSSLSDYSPNFCHPDIISSESAEPDLSNGASHQFLWWTALNMISVGFISKWMSPIKHCVHVIPILLCVISQGFLTPLWSPMHIKINRWSNWFQWHSIPLRFPSNLVLKSHISALLSHATPPPPQNE